MKDYKRFVIWLDYFNSEIPRSAGRRVPLDRAVKDPNISELSESARRMGFEPEVSIAKHPDRMHSPSGYISIEKRPNERKQFLISEFAKTLSKVRGEKQSIPSVSNVKKKSQKAPR